MATRRGLLELVVGFGAARILSAALDEPAWAAYAEVEEKWIRARYELMAAQWPSCSEAARLDMELKLAELRRRAHQFRYLRAKFPDRLRGGVWELAQLPVTPQESLKIAHRNPEYRRNEAEIQRLSKLLRDSCEHEEFRKAQSSVWKSPRYKMLHRKYTGQMQDLQQLHAGGL